jgi:hypothetical protein
LNDTPLDFRGQITTSRDGDVRLDPQPGDLNLD